MSASFRRWPRVRFRLWHLLALVTLLCGWLGYEMNRARKIEAATAAVRGKQGWVRYRHRFTHHSWWDDSGKRAALLGGFGRPGLPAPEWMIKLSSLYYFVSPTVISTSRRYNCNELLPAICSLTSLETLSVHCASSKNLELLKNLPHLQQLHLSGQVGDGCVPLLGSLTSLERLWIDDANISKEGARQLRQLLPECRVFSEDRTFQLPQAEYQLGAAFE